MMSTSSPVTVRFCPECSTVLATGDTSDVCPADGTEISTGHVASPRFGDIWSLRDPVAAGEFLRDVAFPEEGYGCYSTFEPCPDAMILDPGEAATLWETLNTDDTETAAEFTELRGRGFRFPLYGTLQAVCLWYWDGDGVLLFHVEGPHGEILTVLNTDAKKSRTWTVL